MPENSCADAAFNENFIINYKKYSAAVTRFLRGVVYDRFVSEELCQDVFLRVFERRIDLDPESPRTINFFFTVAKNAAIDYLRRKRSEEAKLRSMQIEEAVMDRRFYEDIENICLRGEVLSTLSDVVKTFPEQQRSLFAERCLNGRSATSVARDSGISAYHVRKIEEQARRAIRLKLGCYFGEHE